MTGFCRLRKNSSLACLILLVGCLLMLSACPPKPVPPPFEPSPSVVVTEAGVAFYVKGLRIPGTRQELRLLEGETMTWLPLEQASVVRFTGPIHESYRQAIIFLSSGEQLQGKVFVDFLLEGTTDLGYWNMHVSKVRSLELAFD
jgi:hypothetical protein